jgi:hypothetical protein
MSTIAAGTTTKLIFVGQKHLRIRKSHPSGSNLGGVVNAAEIEEDALHNVFPMATSFELENGVRDWQCLYIHNQHPNVTARGLVMFAEGTSNSSTSMRFGVDPAGVGDGTTFGVAQIIDNKSDPPIDITWRNGKNRTDPEALVLPEITGNKYLPVWFERYIPPGTRSAEDDNIKIIIDTNNIQGDYGIVAVPGTGTDVVTGNTDLNIDLSWLWNMIKGEFGLGNLWFLGNATSSTDNSAWINSLVKFDLKNICKFIFGFLDVLSFTKRNQLVNGVDPRAAAGYQSTITKNVNYISMDTSGFQKYTEPSTQFNKIKEYLEAADRNPNIDFIIINAGSTPYGALPTNDPDPRIRLDTDFRNTYCKLFEQYHVSVVVGSGIHNYQRHHVLQTATPADDNPNTLYTAGEGGAPNYIIPLGKKSLDAPVYINIGTGGRLPKHNIPTPKTYSAFTYVPTGVGYLRWFYTQRTEELPPILEGRFFDVALPGTTGDTQGTNPNQGRIKNLVDRFTITFEEEVEV